MTQQPLVDADEVLEMLREHALNEDERKILNEIEMIRLFKLTNNWIDNPQTQLPVIEKCVKFLKMQNLFVFFRMADDPPCGLKFSLVAGECGELCDKLDKVMRNLVFISEFIKKNKKLLPDEIVAKKRLIDRHKNRIKNFLYGCLMGAYSCGSKRRLRIECDYGWELLEAEENFLKKHEYLLRIAVISSL
jgi:hypothetical protein